MFSSDYTFRRSAPRLTELRTVLIPVANKESFLEVERLREKSVPVSCLSGAGLKLFCPRVEDWCHTVISSYGGGMVDGDNLHLRLSVGEGCKLYITASGFTQVYKGRSSFVMSAEVGAGALVLHHGLPLVPHAGSGFCQQTTWDLHPEAALVAVDWLLPGRVESGERFQFEELLTTLRIMRGRKLVLNDAFRAVPGEQTPLANSLFGRYEALLTVNLIGAQVEPVAQALSLFWNSDIGPVRSANAPDRVVNVSPLPRGGYQLRAAALYRRDLLEVERSLFGEMQAAGLLDFDPLSRQT